MKKSFISHLVIICYLTISTVNGQIINVDSLRNVLSKAKNDTSRISILLKAGDKYETVLPDSALVYYQKALNLSNNTPDSLSSSPETRKAVKMLKAESLRSLGFIYLDRDDDKALRYFLISLFLSEEINDSKGMASCYTTIGNISRNKGDYDKALEYYSRSLEVDKNIGNKEGIATTYKYSGYVHKLKGESVEALELYSNALILFEEVGDQVGISDCLNNIGTIYSDKGDFEKALEYYSKSLKISESAGNRRSMTECYNNVGITYFHKGLYDSTIVYFLKSLNIFKELNNKMALAILYNNIGEVSRVQGKFDKAVEYFMSSLKISEEMGNKNTMAACYSGIGLTYKDQGMDDKAIEYYLMALKIEEALGSKKGMYLVYNNIGNIYYSNGTYEKSMEYYLKSLKICEEMGERKSVATILSNIGNIYSKQGKYDQALVEYMKSLNIMEELGTKTGLTLVNFRLAAINLVIADSTVGISDKHRNERLLSALKYGIKGYKLSLESKALPQQRDLTNTLSEVYSRLGNYREAFKYSQLYNIAKDSMFSEAKTRALTEMSTKYEAEKKQLQIEKMEKQKELDNKTIEAQLAENRKQQIVIFSAVGGLLIVLVFSMIILRMFRQKRKANILLEKQNNEIKQQKDEISSQRDKLSQQNVLLTEQKKEITDSIRYAKRIQTALLPDGDHAEQIFGDHFIIYKPKDIVSGDFYWGTVINGWKIFTVADCTGHGVPGAFMSMLGISFLNEIVRKKEVTRASDIIENLRMEIIEALQQKGTSGEQKDGMDIALCVIDTRTNKAQFCGANNKLIVVKGNKELKEMPSDKMPVAIYENMKPFTNHAFDVESGDTLYLITDGFEDQFGGESDKKFKSARLKSIICEISDKTFSEQKLILNQTFEEWKGDHDQTDDVTILGILTSSRIPFPYLTNYLFVILIN